MRILVKIIPHSMAYISTAEEGGGGNRISEEQIKSYLENTLGEAPRPVWGCPGGWGDYLCGASGQECSVRAGVNRAFKVRTQSGVRCAVGFEVRDEA